MRTYGRWLALAGLMGLLSGCASSNQPNLKSNTSSNTKLKVTSSSNSTSTKTSTSSVKASQLKPLTGPLPGNLLIADRGNSRLLIVTPQKKIIWTMSLGKAGGSHSHGADDAFFTPDYKHIIINEEDNQMLAIIDIATKKIIWTYGHGGVTGSAPGYLNTPDDAYMLPNGLVTTADIKNQRILFINQAGKIVKQYGTTLKRYHNPPYSLAAPNGDTPLKDGGMLITEIGGSYADRLNSAGKLIYTVHFSNIPYPSDTQLLPNNNLLVVDYNSPGRVEEVTPKGKIVWTYYHASGAGMLSNPSLAISLPNGDIVLNDDYNDRVIIIDPKTNRIVWQYGHTGVSGTADGYLNIPDGLDFMPPNVSLPTSK